METGGFSKDCLRPLAVCSWRLFVFLHFLGQKRSIVRSHLLMFRLFQCVLDTLDRTVGDKRHFVRAELEVQPAEAPSGVPGIEYAVSEELLQAPREAVENAVHSACLQGEGCASERSTPTIESLLFCLMLSFGPVLCTCQHVFCLRPYSSPLNSCVLDIFTLPPYFFVRQLCFCWLSFVIVLFKLFCCISHVLRTFTWIPSSRRGSNSTRIGSAPRHLSNHGSCLYLQMCTKGRSSLHASVLRKRTKCSPTVSTGS